MVNIASSAAHTGTTVYGTSKLAVAGLTTAFAQELGPLGIRVNAVSRGLMLTQTIKAELPVETMARVKTRQFLVGDGSEAHVVDAVLFFASLRAEFVTRETLRVTGGAAAGV